MVRKVQRSNFMDSGNQPVRTGGQGIYYRFFKRPLDIILSGCAIVLLAPVMLIIALLVRIKLGSPVIFKQKRPGINEKIFTVYKFRTMTEEIGADGELLSCSERLTKFGKFLRSTSLDELPELYNVLKGDMSVIGPRPLLIQYLPLYNEFQKRRHEVRPGLSGLAQVNGRNAITWEQKFAYDIKYVDDVTFLGDVKIIFLTIKRVLTREGVNASTTVTMEMFKGTK